MPKIRRPQCHFRHGRFSVRNCKQRRPINVNLRWQQYSFQHFYILKRRQRHLDVVNTDTVIFYGNHNVILDTSVDFEFGETFKKSLFCDKLFFVFSLSHVLQPDFRIFLYIHFCKTAPFFLEKLNKQCKFVRSSSFRGTKKSMSNNLKQFPV